MATHAPRAHAHWPNVNSWPAAALGLALVIAGLVGYAVAGGFTGEATSPGQAVADRVNNVWATADPAAIRATYAANVKFLLEMPGERAQFSNRAQLADTIHSAVIVAGYTYTQIGPVSSYTAADGDMYVTSLIEIRGSGHPSGVPAVGFYRVHNGKVIRQIFMDAEHY